VNVGYAMFARPPNLPRPAKLVAQEITMLRLVPRLAVFALLAACGCSSSSNPSNTNPASSTGTGGSTTSAGTGGSTSSTPDADSNLDFDATVADFPCMLTGTKVDRFYLWNKVGKLDEALAVGNAGSGKYPVGTIIQLIPAEAMVKRRAGFSAATNDWEFFTIAASATNTQIQSRGTTEVSNVIGTCAGCHGKAAPQYDFVCEETHGCDPLPFTADQITSIQEMDPRCTD
jgi:hypothetical protein